MKKFNYHMISFIVVAFLVISGWISDLLYFNLKDAVLHFIEKPNIETFIAEVDAASKNISYKNALVDIYSLYYRATDAKVIEKADTTIVKLSNNYLGVTEEKTDDATLHEIADRIEEIDQLANKLEIPFLYVMAPQKLYFEEGSDTRYNYEQFSKIMESRDVDVLDLAAKMKEENLSMENAYFVTDHHWTPEVGFWAGTELYTKLTEDYSLTLDEKAFDIENYDITVYEDMFLGSTGKKVGRYYTPLGLDDISLITPKFDTSLTVSDKKGNREGSFLETLINMEELTSNDYHIANPYAAYSYGNSGLQTIENHFAAEDAPKIVFIRDSFSCPVTPFLSLASEELHVIDIRYWKPLETADTISEYIEYINPDCVVILYALVQPEMFEF